MLLEPGKAALRTEIALQIGVADFLPAIASVPLQSVLGGEVHRAVQRGVEVGADADAVHKLEEHLLEGALLSFGREHRLPYGP